MNSTCICLSLLLRKILQKWWQERNFLKYKTLMKRKTGEKIEERTVKNKLKAAKHLIKKLVTDFLADQRLKGKCL